MYVNRFEKNPIITTKDVVPSRPDFEVVCVFNTGVIRFENEILLLLRVAEVPINPNPKLSLVPIYDSSKGEIIIKEFNKEDKSIDFSDSRFVLTAQERYLTSISHFRVARSKDGINFEIEKYPAMTASNEYEMFGIEDPRITKIEDTYYINYSCCSPLGITTCLASTKDFKTFQRLGVIFPPDNKDVAIFPEKINGSYYAFHRPASEEYEKREIWLAESPNLISWGNHKRIMKVMPGSWESGRIGCGAVPFLIEQGWLEIYHAADAKNRYCLGGVLLDKDQPWKIISKTEKPILQPEEDYEINGFYGNVVFTCGALLEDNIVKLYYGAADTVVAYAQFSLDEIVKSLKTI